MRSPIFFIVPPVVGAIIGYVTNDLAIKMLFRPLKPIRVWKIRLPFTPGILPRQRHQLADNIGRMVERELLTEEILRQRMGQDAFRRSLESWIASFTNTLLSRPLKELFSDLFGDPKIFGTTLDGLLENLFEDLTSHPVRELWGQDPQEFQTALRDLLVRQIGGASDTIALGLSSAMDAAYPNLVQGLSAFLQKPQVRRELETQGRFFLRNAIQKLSLFQRFFITAAQYDRTLHDKMPEIIDDLIDQLTTLASQEDTRKQLVEFTQKEILGLLSQSEASFRLINALSGLILPQVNQSLGDLLRSLTGLSSIEIVKKIRTYAEGALETYGTKNLSSLLALEGERKEALDRFIAGAILNLADRQIANALATIDVRSMVRDRIDSLDMLQVERIVLDVLANQLKWINVFGAILGAIIGLAQVALSVYLP